MRVLLLIALAWILTPRSAPAQETVPISCQTCLLWESHRDDFELAVIEIGPLEDGAVYLFSSSDYRVIQGLQQFAHARESFAQDGLDREHPRFGLDQGHLGSSNEISLEIALSPHGFFAILRSPNPLTADRIRTEASQAVRNRDWVPF